MAIETADIVIETDQPSKVAKAIEIAKRTRTIVVQNIAFAIGVKLLVMVLGIFDIASLWAAVFADTGVTLLAVLNSMRILIKK
jgi:Cd2+/Zn2+-exporting ATPase